MIEIFGIMDPQEQSYQGLVWQTKMVISYIFPKSSVKEWCQKIICLSLGQLFTLPAGVILKSPKRFPEPELDC